MSQIPITNTRNTGWIPDEPDKRDFIFADLISSGSVTTPHPDQPYQTLLWKPEMGQQPTLDLEDFSYNSPGVYDQGATPASCVANSIALAACYAWHKKPGEDQDRITGVGGKLFDPSRWWIWYHARRLAGKERYNTGCNIRNAFKGIHEFGCPPNAAWPYPQLTTGDYPDVPSDVLERRLKEDPDDNMFNIAKQYFVNDFEYYAIKTIGLDFNWAPQGDVDSPGEAPDRIIQMRTALAAGYPIVFALGEWIITDTQDPNSTKWNRHWQPMWEQSNFTVNAVGSSLHEYHVVMNDLDPGFFPVDNPRLAIGDRPNGHVMVVIGSDAKRELFLCQNSYGLYPDMAHNVDKKPYFWMPYNYFRTRLVDATWVIVVKQGSNSTVTPPPLPPPPTPPNPSSNHPLVSIDWSDNFSGVDINQAIQANVGPRNISDVLKGTRIASDGFISSIQVKGEAPSTVATVKKDGTVLGTARGTGNDYAQWPRTALTGVTIEVIV